MRTHPPYLLGRLQPLGRLVCCTFHLSKKVYEFYCQPQISEPSAGMPRGRGRISEDGVVDLLHLSAALSGNCWEPIEVPLIAQ